MANCGQDDVDIMKFFIGNILAKCADIKKGGKMYGCILALEELEVEDSFNEFLVVSDEVFDKIQILDYKNWKEGDKEPTGLTYLSFRTKSLLMRLKWYGKYLLSQQEESTMSVAQWKKNATIDGFRDFSVLQYEGLDKATILGKSNSNNSSPSTPRQLHKPSLAQEFLKGVKRDKTQYEKLVKGSDFPKWHRSIKATAKSHGCENVLDPEYVP
jgi:hypothetical protein